MSEAERALDQAKADTVLSWFRGEPRAPFSIELSPTMACNVNCLFCRRKDELPEYFRRAQDLTDDRWFDIISEAVSKGTKRLFFRGGGEPALKRALFRRLLPIIREKGIYCTLLTNGTLFDEWTAKGFVGAGWAEVIFSLHGGDAESHDFIVDQPGSFAKVERSLELLNECKDRAGGETPHLSFHVVLTRRIFRSIDRIIELAAKHRVGHVGVFPMHNAPYEKYSRELEMRPEDRRAYRELVPKYQAALEAKGLGHDFQLSYQQEDAQDAPEPVVGAPVAAPGTSPTGSLPVGDIPCYYPWFHATITPNGFMSPCCYGEGHQDKGDMAKADFDAAWNRHDMGEVRERMTKGEMMPYCRKCPNWYQGDNRRIRELIRARVP